VCGERERERGREREERERERQNKKLKIDCSESLKKLDINHARTYFALIYMNTAAHMNINAILQSCSCITSTVSSTTFKLEENSHSHLSFQRCRTV
jgi:hypothetical protein